MLDLKSQLWQPRNETLPNGTVHAVMYVNTFWRGLVSPTLAKFTLVISDENFEPIEPWKSQGYSYRWFRRAVQSFIVVPQIGTWVFTGSWTTLKTTGWPTWTS